jgi:hypothetical protein
MRLDACDQDDSTDMIIIVSDWMEIGAQAEIKGTTTSVSGGV